jgi:PTS system nitrogen regulatory IIA component
MYLAKFLSPELIRVKVTASDKWALIDQLAGVIVEQLNLAGKPCPTLKDFQESIVAREHLRTTYIGHGCAMPHARMAGVTEPVACLAILDHPVEYDTPDHKLVQIVCLLVVPEEDPVVMLKIMSQLAGLLSDPAAIGVLENTTDPAVLYQFIGDYTLKNNLAMTAGALMRRSHFDIYPDTPLTEVTLLMEEYRSEAASVIDHDGTLVGEITCDTLFKSGLPEFFTQLRSVAFIRNFDPLENYFKMHKTAVAGDIMTKDYVALPESATLLEVIFEFTAHKHLKVYVTRDGKRVGVIDRSIVLNRVINF